MGGRPTVITDDTVRKLEEAFQDGFNVSEACLTAGISRSAYYERKAADEVFADKMELARKYVSIRAKKVVVQAVNDGNFNAAKWWLERRERSEFGVNASNNEHEEELFATTEPDQLGEILDNLKAVADVALARATPLA